MVKKSRSVLEIGPGIYPLHDRGGLNMNDDEKYIALDIKKERLQGEFWKEMQEKYGDKLQRIVADGQKLPFKNNSQDEIVMLSSNTRTTDLQEVARVLKVCGFVRFGMNIAIASVFLNNEGDQLKHMGFDYMPSENKAYDYNEACPGATGCGEFPYVVLTFKKVK